MKNRSSKTILVFFALGLISCALCVQQAQANINGSITFTGGVELDTTTVNTATKVISWLDENNAMPTVQSASGDFAGLVGATAVFTPFTQWSFTSGPIALFWQVDGFTFSLIASNIVFQGGGFLSVFGRGTISGHGFGPELGTWTFSAQDDPSSGVFSFSAGSEAAPDGGATVALLGLALAGIEGIRRKFMRSKS